MAIQNACIFLGRIFLPEDNEDEIKKILGSAWYVVHNALSHAGDLNRRERLRNEDEFNAYVRPGSNGERKLLQLMGSMAKQQVPWRDLFENGTLLSSL
jgi:hypothetical protein